MTDEGDPQGGKFHVLRAGLPWRTEAPLTECGRDATKLPAADLLTRDEARAKVKAWGARRSALVICMSCADTTNRWPTWDQDPVSAIERAGRGYGFRGHPTPDRRELLARELRAIALLIDAHPDEFTQAVEGLSETTQLADHRRDRARRAR